MSSPPSSTRDRSAIPASRTWCIRSKSPIMLADMKLDVVAIAAGLLHDIVEDTQTADRADQGAVRRRRGARRRRRHQARRDLLLVERRAAGGELPQDAARDGGRHPRHPGEARRSAAQHAHAASPARGAAREDRAGDAGHLRADRQPARHEQDQERARGAGLQVSRAGGVRSAARRGSRGGGARPKG